MSGSSPPEFSTRVGEFLRQCAQRVTTAGPPPVRGKLTRVAGLVMESTGLKVPLGSLCLVEQRHGPPVEAEVVGFAGERLFLMPVSDIHGVSPGALVRQVEPVQMRPRVGQPWHAR